MKRHDTPRLSPCRRTAILTAWALLLAIIILLLSDSAGFCAVQGPVLKWQHGGAYKSWCETGWYSSPAVVDLDGDGVPEVIGSGYSVFALDGRTGALKWRAMSGHDVNEPAASNVGRTWPDIVVADLEGDGEQEIVTAHGGGVVSVYDRNGHLLPGWPWRGGDSTEFRALAVADLDGDGRKEIVVGRAGGGSPNTWVLEPDGSVRSGWPQAASGASGYAAGIYNDNFALADLNGDGKAEVIAPSDVIYVCAYDLAGRPLPANPMYGASHNVWGLVPAYVNPAYELQGWGPTGVADSIRANFAASPATVADLNDDGKPEIVIVGNVYDYSKSPYQDRYCVPYIFNEDRSRLNAAGADWRTPPAPAGAMLTEDYSVIENVQPNPVVADLDGDGRSEIIYPSYDGQMHAIWLDKTEHGHWPYAVHKQTDNYYSFASEPVIADLDGDGRPEVIFGSWAQKGSNHNGRLHILDATGMPLYEVDLPGPFGGGDWNGALAAPTLADIDGDGNLEVVLNTAHSGLVAYGLPGTSRAKVIWGTGRGSMLRTGQLPVVRKSTVRDWALW